MGSSGTGSFGNYSPGESDKCAENLAFDLEEIAQSEYYQDNGNVPAKDTTVQLRRSLYNRRLAVETVEDSAVIGLVPTVYNYLVVCLGKRYSYVGVVLAAKGGKVPTVTVSLNAVAP